MMLLTLCLVVAQPAGPTFAEQVRRSIADFGERERGYNGELRAAGQDRARARKAAEDFDLASAKSAKDLGTLIKVHPGDPAAVHGLIGLVGEMRWPLDAELTRIAIGHRDDPRMGRLCFLLAPRGKEVWARSVVAAVAESTPIREVRAQAIFCRGIQAAGAAADEVFTEADDPLLLKIRGDFQRAATFTDARTPDGKRLIATMAANELRRLDNLPRLKVGSIAPEISGTDLDGNPLKLSDHRGRVVVIVFWGSWCGPCMAMVPHEKALWERMKGRPFALLGVNGGDTREVARRAAAEKGMGWPSWYGGGTPQEGIAREYDVRRWPTVLVLDAGGAIRFRDVWGKELDGAVETLLAEVGRPDPR